MTYSSLSPYMLPIFIVICIALGVLIGLAIIRKKNHLSGEAGEYKVSKMIKGIMKEDELLFNNFLASRNSSNTASIQIDHIFISHKGVFVIETKDYKGRIYGDANYTNWTQVLAYGNVKNKFYNPIKQNETHTNYIYKLLDQKYRVLSAIIFLSAEKLEITNARALYRPASFYKWYKSLDDVEKMDKATIIKIYNKLVLEMQEHPITKEDHITNIKTKHNK